MSESAWKQFEKEHDELLQRWCNEADDDKRAKLWNEIIELWADWKETRK
jgi:hypothetical protein